MMEQDRESSKKGGYVFDGKKGASGYKSARSAAEVTRRKKERADPNVRVRISPDRAMIYLTFLLLGLGTMMVFSASYPSAQNDYGDPFHYIKKQATFVVIGTVVMIAVAMLPHQFYKKMSVLAYAFAFVCLVAVLFIGTREGVAQRWLYIPGTKFGFQPSEFMKPALAMMLGWYYDKYGDLARDRHGYKTSLIWGLIIPGAIVAVPCLVVLAEKHLSGAIILALIGYTAMLLGGSRPWLLTGCFAGAGGIAAGLYLLKNAYALKRITSYAGEGTVSDELWQTTQGLYAIGSGGLLGVGFGNSRQKYSYVSMAQNDFIFTIWCEEMGFIGALAVIAIFVIFIWRGYTIALKAPTVYSSVLVFGIMTKIAIQVFANISVVTNVIPNTGISLPFFSYGGSSLVILMAEMGMVFSVSKHSYLKRNDSKLPFVPPAALTANALPPETGASKRRAVAAKNETADKNAAGSAAAPERNHIVRPSGGGNPPKRAVRSIKDSGAQTRRPDSERW